MSDRHEKGLPCDVDAERILLGSIMLDEARYFDVAGALSPDDFVYEKHRRILRRMGQLQERGEHIDRLTVVSELSRYGELESCDGVSYIVSLDDGLPQIPHIDSYVRIVKEKSTLRQIIYASQHMMNQAMVGEVSSKNILGDAQGKILSLGYDTEQSALRNPQQIIERAGGISAVLGPPKQGLHTGFAKYDDMTGGLQKGELVIIAARPSMGKSALALNIAQKIAMKDRKGVAFFSLEMSDESLLKRMLCAEARVDSQRLRAGYLNRDERPRLADSLYRISESPIFIDETAGIELVEMHSKLVKLMRQQEIELVIVDYLQLMHARGKFENKNQEVTALSGGLKRMAKELGVAMVVLSQLNRAVETRKGGGNRPQLSDLRESGAIEQDADLVVFIFREEMYHRDREDLRGLAELIIAKQRNGPIGTVNLVFLHSQTKFANRAEDVGDEDPLQFDN